VYLEVTFYQFFKLGKGIEQGCLANLVTSVMMIIGTGLGEAD
jgi:hypothetical protein